MNCIHKVSLKYPSCISLVFSCNWLLNQQDHSLLCPEDVGKLSNLVKYCVGLLFSCFSVLVVWVLLRCVYLYCLGFSSWLLPRRRR